MMELFIAQFQSKNTILDHYRALIVKLHCIEELLVEYRFERSWLFFKITASNVAQRRLLKHSPLSS